MRVVSLLSLALVLALVGQSLQLGTLWVNNIRGNSDTNTVVIEEVIVDDNTVFVDFLNGLSQNLVTVEDVEFFEGNVRVPINLLVEKVATIQGLLNTNGGILADDEVFGGFSFKVEDDTGITTIKRGELRPDGGINVDDLKFEVKPSGETTIAEAPLRPNGGINSNNGQFTVSADDGSVRTQGNAEVDLDIIIGTTTLEDRWIRRLDTDSREGGSTIISGQFSPFSGGDLVLLPGYANLPVGAPGNLILGRQEPDDLLITRAASGVQNGGLTTFAGQSSDEGRGGDLHLEGGSTTGLDADGGNVILSPGLPGHGGQLGDIVLGTTDSTHVAFDLTVRREVMANAAITDAGATYFEGQDSISGTGGHLFLRAGSVTGSSVVGAGGDLVLEPGYGSSDAGVIYLGRADTDDISVTRLPVDGDASATIFKGQDSSASHGGDIQIEAGSATAFGNGGHIYLTTGRSANGGDAGELIWGLEDEDLLVRRPDAVGAAGTLTAFFGQDGELSGGDFLIQSGAANNANTGSITLRTPDANNGRSGDISVIAGDSTGTPGDIIINAGSTDSTSDNGGDVTIAAGDADLNQGGSVYLRGGVGAAGNGEVVVQQAARFLANDVDVVIHNGVLRIEDGVNTVELSPDPTNVLTLNGDRLLTARRGSVIQPLSLFPVGLPDEAELLEGLSTQLNALVRELSQCGHGLISVVDASGNIVPEGGTFCNPPRRRTLDELNVPELENYDIQCHPQANPGLAPEDQSCLMADTAIMGDANADAVIVGGP